MARAKHELFDKTEVEISEITKSLAHPARVKILGILTEDSPLSCNDIVEKLPLAQATVSQHLAALKISGLIKDKKENNKVLYSVNKERTVTAFKLLSRLLTEDDSDIIQRKLF